MVYITIIMNKDSKQSMEYNELHKIYPIPTKDNYIFCHEFINTIFVYYFIFQIEIQTTMKSTKNNIKISNHLIEKKHENFTYSNQLYKQSSHHKPKSDQKQEAEIKNKIKRNNIEAMVKASKCKWQENQIEKNSNSIQNGENNSIHKSKRRKNMENKQNKNIFEKCRSNCMKQKKYCHDGMIMKQEKKERKKVDKINNRTKRKQKGHDQEGNLNYINTKKEEQRQTKLIIDLRDKRSTNRQNSGSSYFKLTGKKTKQNQLPSTRQYCIIKGKFVPLQLSTDRKRLDNIFVQTACTSPDISHKRFINTNQDLRKIKHYSNLAHTNANTDLIQKISMSAHTDIGVETIKKQLVHYSVLVKAAQQDIGIQYSDRFNEVSGRKSTEIGKEGKEKVQLKFQQVYKSNQCQKSERSVLLDTMMKLESLELNDSLPFDKLNGQQKRHFRQIFSSMLLKMKSPRSEFPPNFSRSCVQILEIEKLKQNKKEQVIHQQKNEQLEQILMMRLSRQINQFSLFIPKSNQELDTSLQSVIEIFAHIFCFVQMNNEDSLIKSMNNLYGLSYTDKYLCISKYYNKRKSTDRKSAKCAQNKEDFSISTRLKLQILNKQCMNRSIPDQIFVNFFNEIGGKFLDDSQNDSDRSQTQKILKKQSKMQSYKQIHTKCIFDAINELLTPYRPFYSTKGDPFPWTMSPLKCLTFYSIDSQSLQTVIQQIQQKLIKMLKYLCGLHIQPTFYQGNNYQLKQETKDWSKDIVFSIRRQRLTKAIIEQSDQQIIGQQYLELQVDSTCILYQLSTFITQQLIMELFHEIKYQVMDQRATQNIALSQFFSNRKRI